jgi:hypothetical protein
MMRIEIRGVSAPMLALLFLAFFLLYAFWGYRILSSSVHTEVNDILFQIDHVRGIQDSAVFTARHARTHVHPIYVLLVNPIGSSLSYLLYPGSAAVLLNAFTAAAGVALAFVFFTIFSHNPFNASLLSLIFGFSMSQLVFGSVPDTTSRAVCSLILTYVLFLLSLRGAKVGLRYWIPAGILSLGITITNFAQTVICFTVAVWIRSGDARTYAAIVRRVSVYVAAVIGATAVAALAQKMIYPGSRLFFKVAILRRELEQYADYLIFEDPGRVVGLLAKHFFLVNLAAPLPSIYLLPNKEVPSVTFAVSWSYLPIGWVAAVIGVAFIGYSISRVFSPSCANRSFLIGILLCLLFNLFLHCFYGMAEREVIELFVYSGNFTFLVLMLAGSCSESSSHLVRYSLAVWALLLGINNSWVMRAVLAHY